MANKSYNEIPNLSEDWGLDQRNGLPYAGQSVQAFIKKYLKNVQLGNVSGYKYLTSIAELPIEQSTLGYIIGDFLYVYVGVGGDTVNGLYQNVGAFRGEKGDTGERGADGIQGEKGDRGEKGEQGEQGAQGIQGEKGERGEQGIQGEQGEVGVTDVTISVYNTSGIPSASAVIENQVLKIELSGIKGEQGNSGFQGDFTDFEVVNDLTTGGADKALSAEMGKELNDSIFGEDLFDEITITQNDFLEEDCIPYLGNRRIGIFFNVENLEYVARVKVKGSGVKYGFHITDNPTEYGVQIVDSGWLNASSSELVYTNKTSNGKYIRLLAALISNDNKAPNYQEFIDNVEFSLSYKIPKQSLLLRVNDLEVKVSKVEHIEELINSGTTKLSFTTTIGKGLNSYGVSSDSNSEITEYIDVFGKSEVKVTGGFWNSDNKDYSSVIEVCDENYAVIRRIIPSEILGLNTIRYCYIFSDWIDVTDAHYIRFPNFINTPSTNTNSSFTPVTASVEVELLKIDAGKIFDNTLGKRQEFLNKSYNDALFGDGASDETVRFTEEDISEYYGSTSVGGGRGFFSIPIEGYDEFTATIKLADDSAIKAGLNIKTYADYASNVFDGGWILAGGSAEISNNTPVTGEANYIGIPYTYSSGSGIPSIDEFKQHVKFEFVGLRKARNGLVSKVAMLDEKINAVATTPMLSITYNEPLGTSTYIGEKIDVSEHKYTWENYGTISGGSSSRQGGATYGKYLFQFHDNLSSIVIYDLDKKNVVQVLSLSLSSLNSHANSGGFSGSFYDESDPFPLLYIASNREEVIHVFRVTGTEGEYSVTCIQTIQVKLPISVNFLSATVDSYNNKLIIYGYKGSSWQEPTDKCIVAVCEVPSHDKSETTITDTEKMFYIPHMYATQDAIARYGKLYVSFGNTGVSGKMGGMIVVDYISGNVLSLVDFKPIGSFEPESLHWYKGNIYVVSIAGVIYKLNF